MRNSDMVALNGYRLAEAKNLVRMGRLLYRMFTEHGQDKTDFAVGGTFWCTDQVLVKNNDRGYESVPYHIGQLIEVARRTAKRNGNETAEGYFSELPGRIPYIIGEQEKRLRTE